MEWLLMSMDNHGNLKKEEKVKKSVNWSFKELDCCRLTKNKRAYEKYI